MSYYIQTTIEHDDTVGYQVVLIRDDNSMITSSPTYSEYAEARKEKMLLEHLDLVDEMRS